MIVADANILVGFVCQPERRVCSEKARALDPVWVLPPLWRHEFMNALVQLVKHRHYTAAEARNIWRETVAAFDGKEQPVDMDAALGIAISHGVSGYDAQYVALAEALDAPLLTEDRELLRKFPQRAVSLEMFARRRP